MSKTYFINNVDSYLGRNILDKIRGPETDDQQPENNVLATKLDPEDFEKPRGVKKILKRAKPLLFKKFLTEQDVLIYDTVYGNPEDVLFALEAYRKAKELTGEKILILVSSLATWTQNGKKVRKEKQADDQVDDGDGKGDDANADAAVADDAAPPAPPAAVEPKPAMKGFDEDDDDKKPDDTKPADAVEVRGDDQPPAEPVAEPTAEAEETPPEPILLPWTDKDFADRLPLERYSLLTRGIND